MARPLQLDLLQFRNAQLSIMFWLQFRRENQLVWVFSPMNNRTDNAEMQRNNNVKNERILRDSELGH